MDTVKDLTDQKDITVKLYYSCVRKQNDCCSYDQNQAELWKDMQQIGTLLKKKHFPLGVLSVNNYKVHLKIVFMLLSLSLEKINTNIPEKIQDLSPLIFYDWPRN